MELLSGLRPQAPLLHLETWQVDTPTAQGTLQVQSTQTLVHGPGCRFPTRRIQNRSRRTVAVGNIHQSEGLPHLRVEKAVIGIRNHTSYPLNLPNVARNVIAHELGHAIGLGHNDDRTTLMCGRPAPCRPDAFQSEVANFFPLTKDEKATLLTRYPRTWNPLP